MRSQLAAGLLMAIASAGAAPLDDPMRPPGQQTIRPAASQPPLQLSSVVIGRDRRLAVINGERVTEGSRVAGASVVSITPSRVILRRGGKLVTLSLLNLQVKAISKAREDE